MYKVFIENKAIIFKKGVGKLPDYLEPYFPSLKTKDLSLLSLDLEKHPGEVTVLCPEPLEEIGRFFCNFKYLEAAGGVVKSTQEPYNYLFIYRWGKWDLPKGKLERKELPSDGAEREIKEESGITDIHLITTLSCTWHVYYKYQKYVLKKTHWFLFEADNQQKLIPQTEEDIERVKWFYKEEFERLKSETYPSLHAIIEAVKNQ